MRRLLLLAVLFLVPALHAQPHTLVPVPETMTRGSGFLALDSNFAIVVEGVREARLTDAATRLRQRVGAVTGLVLMPPKPQPPSGDRAANVKLRVVVARAAAVIPGPSEDESYTLEVAPSGAVLRAASSFGALRGMETFLQLAEGIPGGARVPAVQITDRPRFPWRGLLLDVCRHWLPIEVVKRTLDAMAAVKLNVLHWHLSEDQGFRVESRRYPRLHQMGSDGQFYTQAQVREVVAYAAARGIRVVPEFDVPGHATAWLVGHPEIASKPGPYEILRRWGVSEGILDPTNEATYRLLDGLFGEMAALFPDPYFHIGGDEVPPETWRNSERIQAWMRARGIADEHALQAHFNRRLQTILTRHGKRMMGWDEILHPDLPTSIMIHSWRGKRFLAQSAERGYTGVLSNGYYIDLYGSAAKHYLNDPLEGLDTLSAEAKARVLGGEATMWAEMVTPEIADHRIWPRTGAIAERLWSPASVRDTLDLYRRLDALTNRLELADGLRITSAQRAMQARIAGPEGAPALAVLAGLVEPVEGYARHGQFQRAMGRRYSQHTPLNRLIDAIPSDAARARRVVLLVDTLLKDPAHEAGRAALTAEFAAWRVAAAELAPLAAERPLMQELAPLIAAFADVAALGQTALDALATGRTLEASDAPDRLNAAMQPKAEVVLVVVPALRRLVEAARATR